MIFTHDVEHALASIVRLVNTSPRCTGEERLPDVAALRAFVEQQRVSEVGELTDRDLDEVRGLREQLHDILLASRPAKAAALVNALVAGSRVTPRLTDHDGYDWHVHYFAPGAALAEHLALDGAMALAQVLSAGELDRLRRCEAPGCDRVLVDLSRNRSKRYCDSRTCGNRLHVAAYRERRRAAVG